MSFAFRSSTTKLLRRPSLRRHASTTTPIESDFTHRFKTTAYTVAFAAGATAFVVYYADSRSAIHRYVVPPLSRALLDAETAHKVALGVLSRGLGPKDTVEDDQVLKVEIWDIVLTNPVGLAAGFDKDGEAVNGLLDLGFGWVEIGSVTPRPQPGNDRPRVFHLTEDSAVINRYGFPSKGAISVLTRLQSRYQTNNSSSEPANASLRDGKLLSINLGKNKTSAPDSIADFLLGIRTFGPLADVLVINVSSPNTPGLRNLQSRGMLIELLSVVKRERDSLNLDRPLPKLLVKIAPDLSKQELEDVAEAVRETNLDGVIVSNTTIQRPSDLKSKNKTETGGLSGPPLKSLTLKALKTLRPLLPASIPIIGCGGISSGADALEYAKAGASVVQVYTSFAYGGAGTPRRIKDEVATLLRQSKQTWMDVVKEGQKLSLQQEEPKVEQHKTIEDIKQYVQDGASELADLKNQLLDILKDESTPPTKDVQST